jgi:alpha-galactosidase
MKRWVHWLRAVEDRHRVLHFRQDLPGFGEPGAGRWDGFQRINDETKSGGLVGVFRAGAAERERQVTVAGLGSDARYQVRRAPDGNVVATGSGAELARDGFRVGLEQTHDGMLFEIVRE